MTPLFYRYEPHVTKVNKNIQNEKLTFLEEIRGIQNCKAGKSQKLNSSILTSILVEVQYFDEYFHRSPGFWDLEFLQKFRFFLQNSKVDLCFDCD